MTRKDYVMIARAIHDAYLEAEPADRQTVRWVTDRIATALESSEPNFDFQRFIQAANPV